MGEHFVLLGLREGESGGRVEGDGPTIGGVWGKPVCAAVIAYTYDSVGEMGRRGSLVRRWGSDGGMKNEPAPHPLYYLPPFHLPIWLLLCLCHHHAHPHSSTTSFPWGKGGSVCIEGECGSGILQGE